MTTWSSSSASPPRPHYELWTSRYVRYGTDVVWDTGGTSGPYYIGADEYLQRTGNRNPLFHELITRGEIVPTSVATLNKGSVTHIPCDVYQSMSGVPDGTFGHSSCTNLIPHKNIVGTSYVPPGSLDSGLMYQRAYMKYVDRYDAAMLDLSTFLGEAPEMIEQLDALAPRLRDALNRVHDRTKRHMRYFPRKGRNISAALDAVGNIILEWNLGFAPLFSDTKSIAELMAELYSDVHPAQKPRRRVEQSFRDSVTTSVVDVPNLVYAGGSIGPFQSLPFRVRYKVEEMGIVKLGSIFQAARIPTIFELAGLTPRSVIPTLWELMTGSWLVDYVFPLGDFFKTWSERPLGLDSWQVYIQETKATTTSTLALGEHNLLPYIDVACSGEASTTARRFTFSRSPWDGHLPVFDFKVPKGPVKWANMIAYATQRGGLFSRQENVLAPVRVFFDHSNFSSNTLDHRQPSKAFGDRRGLPVGNEKLVVSNWRQYLENLGFTPDDIPEWRKVRNPISYF